MPEIMRRPRRSVWVDARDYGVTADGATNDSTALASALSAASSGAKCVQLPAGTIKLSTRVDVPSGVTLQGVGDATIVTGAGLNLFSDATVQDLALLYDGTQTRAITRDTASATTRVTVTGCLFRGAWADGIYVDRGPTSSSAARWLIAGNRFQEYTNAAIFCIRANDFIITGNDCEGTSTSRSILFYGGRRNRIADNRINSGVTGILFLFQRSTAGYPGTFIGNVISGNTVAGVSEEGISFDIRGNVAADIAVIDRDTVASTSTSGANLRVTLTNAGWTGTNTWLGHYLCFMSGALKGRAAEITAQAGTLFTIDVSSEEHGVIAGSDTVVLGLPALRNVITGNAVNATSSTTTGIVLWGLAYGNAIVGNTIIGPTTANASKGGIVVASLSSLTTSTVNVTGSAGRAPSEYNVVTGNVVERADIYLQFKDYGTDTFNSYGNVAVANALIGGRVVSERQQPIAIANPAVFAHSVSSIVDEGTDALSDVRWPTTGTGPILTSADGTRWRIVVDDAGEITAEEIT